MTPLDDVADLFKAATRPAQFKTVMSRAYYVSFARLVGVSIPRGFQPDARPPPGTPHAGVHSRLRDFLKRSDAPILRKIGLSLIGTLYDLRIKADYRLTAPVTRPEAEESLLIATDIHDWIDEARLPTSFTVIPP